MGCPCEAQRETHPAQFSAPRRCPSVRPAPTCDCDPIQKEKTTEQQEPEEQKRQSQALKTPRRPTTVQRLSPAPMQSVWQLLPALDHSPQVSPAKAQLQVGQGLSPYPQRQAAAKETAPSAAAAADAPASAAQVPGESAAPAGNSSSSKVRSMICEVARQVLFGEQQRSARGAGAFVAVKSAAVRSTRRRAAPSGSCAGSEPSAAPAAMGCFRH